jgi:hypothetical protein
MDGAGGEIPLPDLIGHAITRFVRTPPAGHPRRYYYVRDRHYVVRDEKVVIVDEFTGRLAEGRQWRTGLHQAIEAREGLDVSVATGEAARVTVQDLCLQYPRLCGDRHGGQQRPRAENLPAIDYAHESTAAAINCQTSSGARSSKMVRDR